MAVLVGYRYDWVLMREKGRWKLHVAPAEGKVEHGEREKRIPSRAFCTNVSSDPESN